MSGRLPEREKEGKNDRREIKCHLKYVSRSAELLPILPIKKCIIIWINRCYFYPLKMPIIKATKMVQTIIFYLVCVCVLLVALDLMAFWGSISV